MDSSIDLVGKVELIRSRSRLSIEASIEPEFRDTFGPVPTPSFRLSALFFTECPVSSGEACPSEGDKSIWPIPKPCLVAMPRR